MQSERAVQPYGYGETHGRANVEAEARRIREEGRRRRKAESRRRSTLKGRAAMEADPADPRHGTLTGYCYGCRCERCREAKRDRDRKARADVEPVRVPDRPHVAWLAAHRVPVERIATAYGTDVEGVERAIRHVARMSAKGGGADGPETD